MRTTLSAAIMLSCSCLSINQSAATPPTPVDRYRDDLTCASMAVALKNDQGVAKADPAPDPAELDTLVDKTHAIAITSGRALSKGPSSPVRSSNLATSSKMESLIGATCQIAIDG